jgi:hypothetical protein
LKTAKPFLLVIGLVLLLALFQVPRVSGFSPHQRDTFTFSEVVNVGNGTGPNYNGYTEQTTLTGTERVNTVYPNETVSEYYSFTWTTVNNQGLHQPGSSSGNYTFSSTSFMYLKGDDNQSGYRYYKPTVWFAIDSSTPQGGTFTLLNTLMTVQSTNYNYHLSSQNENVYTIYAQSGVNSYQRNDVYGKFSASYTWNTNFDPASGYIVGYAYNEQDTNSTTGDGFSYTDNLSVTSSSYPLSIAPTTSSLTQYLIYFGIFVLVIILIVVLAVAVSRRRRRLPKHLSFQQMPQQYPQQPPPQINLSPKEPPVQQIVVKEIVKVKCKYCGALIDGTVQACPFCGAPRT